MLCQEKKILGENISQNYIEGILLLYQLLGESNTLINALQVFNHFYHKIMTYNKNLIIVSVGIGKHFANLAWI